MAFTIEQNNIPDVFECYYHDEYGNRAHLKRDDDRCGFYMRIIPDNKNVIFPLIRVSFPLDQTEKGIGFRLKFRDGVDHSSDKDIKAAIDGAAELMNRWICMVSDVNVLDFDTKNMHVGDPEGYARLKIESLTKYEELRELGNAAR